MAVLYRLWPGYGEGRWGYSQGLFIVGRHKGDAQKVDGLRE